MDMEGGTKVEEETAASVKLKVEVIGGEGRGWEEGQQEVRTEVR